MWSFIEIIIGHFLIIDTLTIHSVGVFKANTENLNSRPISYIIKY